RKTDSGKSLFMPSTDTTFMLASVLVMCLASCSPRRFPLRSGSAAISAEVIGRLVADAQARSARTEISSWSSCSKILGVGAIPVHVGFLFTLSPFLASVDAKALRRIVVVLTWTRHAQFSVKRVTGKPASRSSRLAGEGVA